MPTKKETRVAQRKLCGRVLFPTSSIFAPRTIGIDNKKENLTAFFSFNPSNNPDDIVVPLLETPLKRESTCARPINKAPW